MVLGVAVAVDLPLLVRVPIKELVVVGVVVQGQRHGLMLTI